MSFKRPPTMDEWVKEHGLPEGEGIHTFSNGSMWESWASGNCYGCRWWDADECGGKCAFEGLAFMHKVTPELATLFGWTKEDYSHSSPETEWRFGWDPPEDCPFFFDDDDLGPEPPPPPDPNQLSFFPPPDWPADVTGPSTDQVHTREPRNRPEPLVPA